MLIENNEKCRTRSMHEVDYIAYSILLKERELLENRGIEGRSIFLEKCICVD